MTVGSVHRDLKPENIFLQTLAGASCRRCWTSASRKRCTRVKSQRAPAAPGTAAGVLVGTIEYMAPEQVAGDDVDPSGTCGL
jgi:serine/threonine protein kinase